MSDKDWTDLGNNIRDMVDDAVKSQDFRRLNENICRTVTDGLDTISRNIKKNIGYGENQGPYQNNNGQWGPPYSNGPAGPQAGPDGSNPGGPYQNGAGGWKSRTGRPGTGSTLGTPERYSVWDPGFRTVAVWTSGAESPEYQRAECI